MFAQKRSLYLSALLMEICYGLFLLIASLLAVKVIESPFVLGLTGTVHVLTRVAGNYIFGRLSDRIGRKGLMIFSCLLSLVAFFILLLEGESYIFLAYFVGGVSNSIFWPVVEAWIGHGTDNEHLLKFLGTFGMMFTGGVTIGNLAGGFFMKIAPLVSITFGSILLIIITVLIIRTRDHQVDETNLATAANQKPELPEAVTPDLATKFLLVGWIANFATWTAIGIFRFLFTKLCVALGIPTVLIGSINAVLYSAWFLMFILMMFYRGWIYKLRPLISLQLLGGAALLWLWVAPTQATFFIAFAMFGFSAGMTYLSSMFYGQNGSRDRGGKSGLHEMVLGLGMLLGPFAGGIIAELFSLQASFLFAAIIIFTSICWEMVLLRKEKIHLRAK